MKESEVKEILLSLVEPNRNDAASSSRIHESIIGWRFPSSAEDTPVCEWTGVECDHDDGTVIGLDLEKGLWLDSLLGGHPPAEENPLHSRSLTENPDYLQKHRVLQSELDPSAQTPPSSIAPFLPSSLGKLVSLKMIKLSSNQIQGSIPKSITRLPDLQIFDVSSNDITGTFPHFSSETLMDLDISKNRFHGTLPKDLFAHPKVGPGTAPYLKALVKFDVSHNGFNGTIPLNGRSGTYDEETKKDPSLKKLKFFDVGFNLFSGTIPNNFGDLASLKSLFLEHNRLIGTIPKALYRGSGLGANPLPLVQLYLEQNNLSGTLPSGLATLPDLKELFVDGNKLTGTIPEVLCTMELNNEFLADDEAAKGCDGVSCPANSISPEGVAPCLPCPDDGGFNRYLGRHETKCLQALNEVEILDRFYELTHGKKWTDESYHWEKGSPACQRKGVECNKEGKVVSITLSSLGLRGSLPTELGALNSLKTFNVSDNELTGFLPSDFRFAGITQFDVKGNELSGSVPILLCIKEGINNNGKGPEDVDFDLLYSCDNIVCQRGSYSELGRASVADSITCLPCYDDAAMSYLGRDTCTDWIIFGKQVRDDDAKELATKAVPAVVVLSVLMFVIARRIRQHASLRAKYNSKLSLGSISSHRNIAMGGSRSNLYDDDLDDAFESHSDDDWTAAHSEGEIKTEMASLGTAKLKKSGSQRALVDGASSI